MAKLWGDKDLDKRIEKFVVGNDYILDRVLLKYDCIASIAHTKMLKKIEILNDEEQKKLEQILLEIIEFDKEGKINIIIEDEDSHTFIENYLTEKLGDLGEKIHTCRSRNDQVKVALSLYSNAELIKVKQLILDLINSLKRLDVNIEIPGYTHYKKAMPSSFSLWSRAFITALEDDIKILDSSYDIMNQNPLGSGAGYGIPIQIDREITKKELEFNKIQEIGYVQNSRGKFEGITLNLMTQIMLDLNKISSDIIFFSTDELKFVSLSKNLTTGSSIMPQKNNPDVLETIRGKYSIVLGYEFQVKSLISNLISGYHKDFALTKEALIEGIETTKECLEIMKIVIENLQINEENCKKAMTNELYATKETYNLVKKGVPFRKAYKEVKDSIK